MVARNEQELAGLDQLYQRGQLNQVDLKMISLKEAQEIEPLVNTVEKALWSPTTASVNPVEIMNSVQQQVLDSNIQIKNNCGYLARDGNSIKTTNGKLSPGYVINAAGLYADKIARDYGFSEDYRILPFKGLYLYANE